MTNLMDERQAATDAGDTSLSKIAYCAMLTSWLFDFRSEGQGAGAGIQIFFLICYLLFFGIFFVSFRGRSKLSGEMIALIGMVALFVFVGFARATLADQSNYATIRNTFGVFCYITAAFATYVLFMAREVRFLRSAFAVFALLYAGNSLIIFFLQGKLDLATVRYQIIGASTFYCLAFIPAMVIYRLRNFELAALLVSSGVLVLSVTRTFILATVIQFIPFLSDLTNFFRKRIVVLVLVVAVLTGGLIVYGQAAVGRWTERIEGSQRTGVDPTLYARQSEWSFMLNKTTEGIPSLLLGNGLAAKTKYVLPKNISRKPEFDIGWGHGHFISLLFIAGLIGGAPLIVFQTYLAFAALFFARRAARLHLPDSNVLFLGTVGGLAFLGNIIAGMLSAPYATRTSGLWFGLVTGLFLGARAYLREMQPKAVANPVEASGTRALTTLPPAVARRRAALQAMNLGPDGAEPAR